MCDTQNQKAVFLKKKLLVKNGRSEIISDLHDVGVRLHITVSAKAENGIKISKPTEKGLLVWKIQHLLSDVSHFLNKTKSSLKFSRTQKMPHS